MRSLPFLKFLLLPLILLACSPASRKSFRPVSGEPVGQVTFLSPFQQVDFGKALFKASLKIKQHELTGLVLIKRMADTSYRFYFANEFGMTFFDLELKPGSMVQGYVFEPMNKKALLRILGNDLDLLIFSGKNLQKKVKWLRDDRTGEILVKNGPDQYLFGSSSSPLSMVYSGSNFLSFIEIRYADWSGGFPASVVVENPGIGLLLELNLIRLN